MNKQLRAVLAFIFHFSALRLGILVTLGIAYLAFLFFLPSNRSNWINVQIREIHQASVDLRLTLRGALTTNSDVAIVAVDDDSVEKLGRWPWPRGRIAEIIETVIQNGAQVIGFDAVFSEPDNNQAVVSLNRLLNLNHSDPQLKTAIEKELSQANTDEIFAQAVGRLSPRLVMGIYFSRPDDYYSPYQEYCGTLVSKETYPHKRLEQEDKAFLVVGLGAALPEVFAQILGQQFGEIENLAREAGAKEGLAPAEIDAKVESEKRAYCDRWLVKETLLTADGAVFKEKDEYYDAVAEAWPEIRKSLEGDWAGLSFEEAADRIREGSFFNNPVERVGKWTINYPSISDQSKNNAYFNADLDSDGTIRRSILVTRFGDLYLPSLATKMAMVGQNLTGLLKLEEDPHLAGSLKVSEFTLNDAETGDPVHTLPTDETGRMLINYAGPSYSFPHIPVHELLNGKDTMKVKTRRGSVIESNTVNKAEFLKGKYLLFGATAVGIYDLRVTPFEENYPGVETHANALNNILQDTYLRDLPNQAQKLMVLLVGLGIGLSLALAHLGAISGLLVTLLTLVGIYFFDRYFLFEKGLVTLIIFPLSLVSILYIFLTFYKYLTEERKKKAIKGTFEKYVSPAIVDEVLKNPENIELGGKKLRMTVMFSDVRGFTTISEKLDPQMLVKVLNTYLTPMTNLVFKNKGTLDKYMGDAIMSFFGAPIHYEDHAKAACQCALDMMELLPEINKGFQEKGLPTIDIGIGLNTGDMSVGNMGSDTVRSYTVMGDSVNLGSRLEGINKQYGTHIIISEFTHEEVKNDFHCRELDWVRVKGKLQPVRIYELMARKGRGEFPHGPLIEAFKMGFELYHARKWQEALARFNEALNIKPDDAASQLYVERIQHYLSEEPAADWDGVYEMKTK